MRYPRHSSMGSIPCIVGLWVTILSSEMGLRVDNVLYVRYYVKNAMLHLCVVATSVGNSRSVGRVLALLVGTVVLSWRPDVRLLPVRNTAENATGKEDAGATTTLLIRPAIWVDDDES